ncbi:ATP-binding protein [Streptosporangium sp. NPDC049078]|uniref:ATP-binding protein n=1 Tax=Streptosporangium sp. NPDC049078 TaxID=3155767 RepID=UPI0034138C75
MTDVASSTQYLKLSVFPTSPYYARVHVRRVLESWHRDDLIETAQLLVSELISNAITAHTACPEAAKAIPHADPDQIWMDVYRMGETVVLRVWDASPLTPVVRDPGPDDENGRGLHLVDLLATEWGYYRPTPGGKIVWCTLAPPPPEEQEGTIQPHR